MKFTKGVLPNEKTASQINPMDLYKIILSKI